MIYLPDQAWWKAKQEASKPTAKQSETKAATTASAPAAKPAAGRGGTTPTRGAPAARGAAAAKTPSKVAFLQVCLTSVCFRRRVEFCVSTM